MEEEVSAKLMDECGVVPQEWSVEEPEDTTENITEDLHDVNEAREDQELQENDISMVNADSLSRLQKEDPSLRNCREQAYKTPDTVGIPKTILTDQGSNFTSELLKQLHNFLKVRGITTSPYHPEANGKIERFNGTLKSMLKKLCVEKEVDWDI
ncbi:unnamed protein product [Mytilus coruscus]|uniref:Integrase catalytic domain-containing protein n=1 Tax=Mytilus coruscus TaxID=42192 RepID=A0A6J8BUB6_MYTCO|nr:unnamed protein product [Mytilus coruscus]